MKAVIMAAPGEPEVLQLQQWPDPVIQQPTELLIRLKAAGVNPIDTKLRTRGTFFPDRMPAILGCDGAGIVEAVGAQVQRFKVGDEVYFCNGGIGKHPGNYAEFATVDERFAASKPAALTFVEAGAVPLILITAWEALYDRGRLEVGQRILIHAGAGGVGHMAIQLARYMGVRVCTTVGSQEKADFVAQLGAEAPILYQETDFVSAALDWSEGIGVDLALDTVGGTTLSKTFAAVRFYGDVVTLLEPGSDTDWKTARLRNLRFGQELMLTPMLQELVEAQQHQADILQQCSRLFDQGQLIVHVSQTFPLEAAAEAHRLLEAGSTMGKIVLLT